MGGADVAAGEGILNRANIPTFPYPDTAARMFDYMAHYADNLSSLYETPVLREDKEQCVDSERASKIIETVRQSGRTILTEYEAKQVLQAYCIPTVDTRIARTEEQAVKTAADIGYPVVLKIYSETITHKTDVGGVQLNLADANAVREAYNTIQESVTTKVGAEHFQGVTVQPMAKLDGYELILGSSLDNQFGPVLLFGMGGQLVEVFKDSALALPPLNTTLARRMMEQTKIYKALKGVRGRKPVDLEGLEQILVRFSQLIAEQKWIMELDINPLLVSSERLLALDARIVIYGKEVTEDKLHKLAIRPYPSQYVTNWKSKNGDPFVIRPVRAEDEPLLVKFHESLSDRTVYMRYLHPMLLTQRVAHERLARICHCDYDREITLVAECEDPKTGEHSILAAARMSKLHGLDEARFSILVTDAAQGMGLGKEMLRRLIQVSKDEKLRRLEAIVTADNDVFKKLCQELGFQIGPDSDGKIKLEMSF
jgi:acetyltransferase